MLWKTLMSLLGLLCQILTKKKILFGTLHGIIFNFPLKLVIIILCFDVFIVIVCRGRNCYLFLARGLVCTFSACWEWEDLLQFGILGSIPQSVVEFSYHGIYYLLRISAMLECISDWLSGLTQDTVTNCLLHLNSDKAFAGFQTCMFNKCHRRFQDIHNIIF